MRAQPIVFDSYDMSPVLFGTGKSARKSWFYFTEDELKQYVNGGGGGGGGT